MILRGRADNLLERHELREWRHLIVRYLDIHIVQRGRVETILRCGAYPNLIYLTELVEVTHIRTTAVRTEGAEHRLSRGTGAFTLNGIHMHFEFWETLRESGHRARYLLTLHQFHHQRIGLVSKIGEVSIASILHLQVDTIGCTISRNLWHLERQYLRILNRQTIKVETIHDIVDIMFGPFTLIPILQTDNQRGVTRSIGRDQSISAHQTVTLQLRNGLHFLFHLLHYLAVLVQRRTFRHTNLTHDNALVFLRNETRRHNLHEQYEQHHSGG